MKIKEIALNQREISFEAEVISKEEPRTFTKFGKAGRVCNATVQDSSGEIVLTLWNEDIEKIQVGQKVRLEKGCCSEFRDLKQVSAGRYGRIEII